jgi:hypothetical protein
VQHITVFVEVLSGHVVEILPPITASVHLNYILFVYMGETGYIVLNDNHFVGRKKFLIFPLFDDLCFVLPNVPSLGETFLDVSED